jgi:hypothetical protein
VACVCFSPHAVLGKEAAYLCQTGHPSESGTR